MSNRPKAFAAIVFVLLVAGFFAFGLERYFTLEYLKASQADLATLYQERPLQVVAAYFVAYVLVTGLSLPGAAIMTLLGGAMFGLLLGTVIVSFASTLGATIAFLFARLLLRDFVQRRFGSHLETLNEGVRRDGAFYLFTLRLVPVFPFFVVNLAMALTPIRTLTFFWVSQVGMLAGTVVFVNAGTALAQVEAVADILSPPLLVSFALLGVFPLLAKKILDLIKARRVYARWSRPAVFERDAVVIGGGSAGLVTAYICAAVRAKVTLVEQHRMGGDCLNTGCVPSKALIRSARFLAQARRAQSLGFKSATVDFDFAQVMARVRRVIAQVEPHDSVERYESLGVDCVAGRAVIRSPFEVEVDGRLITTRNIVIAAGARPFVPPVPGIEEVGYLTSDTVWNLVNLPERLVVLGGGPIGSELAQCFARFGSQVTQVEMLPRLLIREDPEVSEMVMSRFQAEGVDVRVNHRAKEFVYREGRKVLVCEHHGSEVEIEFDELLVAVGRTPNTAGYGLEELGVDLRPGGTVDVDRFMRTRYPNVFACGDVTGPYQFTHVSAHQAWYAAVNALFGGFKKFAVDYAVIPWATFTEPEVARVGLNETDAAERGVAYEVTTYGIEELDRAIADEEAYGMVKVLTVPGKDTVLGATIVGEHAGELIGEFVSAMKHGLGMNKILGTIHIYPTLAEANKYAAGEWKRAHAPEWVLRWLSCYHSWRRG